MIVCVAAINAEVAKVATRELLSVPVPSVVVPSLNVTTPVGTPAPEVVAATVAVKVTDWPNTEGFVPEVTVVDVES